MAAAQPYEPTTAPFLLSVPFVPGVNRVELLDKNGAMLASRTASAHSPSITVQFPNAAGLTLDGVQTIQWTGSDLDGDALTYSVLYSEDNGATWDALAVGLAETTYEADFGSIPGSSAASIKVLASDGFNTSADVSDQTFAVPAKAPLALIVSPTPGATFSAGETIKLQGYGVDLEDGSVAV